jgi:hypothetical protein
MSVAEIVKEVPNLSLDEMKEVARALREAMEDAEDLSDVMAVLNNPGKPIPMNEIRKKYRPRNGRSRLTQQPKSSSQN